jgi:hypothetical protein
MPVAPVVLRKPTVAENQDEEAEATALRFRAAYVFDMTDTS